MRLNKDVCKLCSVGHSVLRHGQLESEALSEFERQWQEGFLWCSLYPRTLRFGPLFVGVPPSGPPVGCHYATEHLVSQ